MGNCTRKTESSPELTAYTKSLSKLKSEKYFINWINLFKSSINISYPEEKYHQYWHQFKKGLENYVNNNISIKWFVDATFLKKASLTYQPHHRFSDRDFLKWSKRPTNLNSNRLDDSVASEIDQKRNYNKEIETDLLNHDNDNENEDKIYGNKLKNVKMSLVSTEASQKSQKNHANFSSNHLKKKHKRTNTAKIARGLIEYREKLIHPARRGLYEFLKKTILEDTTHYVWEVMSVFKKIFNDNYKYLEKPENKPILMKKYDEIKFNIIQMKNSMVVFIKSLYIEYFKLLINCQKSSYDIEENAIIESFIYQIMFDCIDCLEYKLINIILKEKVKEASQNFMNVCQKLKHYTLKQFESNLPPVFWLTKRKLPYECVILEISFISKKASPYLKYAWLDILEAEMTESVINYYKEYPNDPYKKPDDYIINKLDYDVVIPLLQYCLLNSNNPELIVDILFMEEFLIKSYIEKPKFQILKNSIEHMITGDIYKDLLPLASLKLSNTLRDSNNSNLSL